MGDRQQVAATVFVGGLSTVVAGVGIIAWDQQAVDHLWGYALVALGVLIISASAVIWSWRVSAAETLRRDAQGNRGVTADTVDGAAISQTTGQHGNNLNVGTIIVNPPFESGNETRAVPVLEFSDPVPDDKVGIVDQQGIQHTAVRIWRVELRNMVEGTEATDVEVVIARSIPPLATFPVDLHKFHDDNAPYTQCHNVRHNAPITFDVIAKDHRADEFYLWRSDLQQPRYTYIYLLSTAERATLLGGIRDDGAILILRAAGNAPLKTKEKAYRLFIDSAGQFIMETVQPEL